MSVLSPFAAFASSAALSAAPSMVSTRVTSGWLASLRMRRPSSTLLPSRRTTSGLLASSPRISSAPTMPLATASHDGDAAEDVHEHALDLRVVEDHVEAVGHHLGGRAATDVEEVGGLHAAVRLAGVRDDVEGAHHEARAVADDADRAVELDVVEALGLGLRLERVGGLLVLELRVVRVAELGVLVERDLAVERLELVAGQAGQRVDLDEGGVLLDEDLPQRSARWRRPARSAPRGSRPPRRSRGPWPRRRRCPGRSRSA